MKDKEQYVSCSSLERRWARLSQQSTTCQLSHNSFTCLWDGTPRASESGVPSIRATVKHPKQQHQEECATSLRLQPVPDVQMDIKAAQHLSADSKASSAPPNSHKHLLHVVRIHLLFLWFSHSLSLIKNITYILRNPSVYVNNKNINGYMTKWYKYTSIEK